jgi:putative ABC transport system substrate-binding protein
MRRREFIFFLSAIIWPRSVGAQPTRRLRQLAVLMSIAHDRQGDLRLVAFRDKLRELGWAESENISIDACWADADLELARLCALSQVRSAPEVILASGPESVVALKEATGNIPIVFVQIGAPVESGVVSDLAHPGDNLTGSAAFEHAIAGKWLELLKQIAPRSTHIGVLSNRAAFTQFGYLRTLEAIAPSLGVRILLRDASTPAEIGETIDAFASEMDALIVLPSSAAAVHCDLIVSRVAQRRLPAIYPYRFFAEAGGLLSYGNNVSETYRQAAVQVDRILRGASPGDLPVQLSLKFELVINLKTAKTLALGLPRTLLARADEVIE